MTPSDSRIQIHNRLRFLIAALAISAATSAVASPLFTGPFIIHEAGYAPTIVAVADMNGDGRPDLVVGHYNSPGAVSIMLGAPGGGYAPTHDFATANYPATLAVGDLNGDGK